MCVNVAINSTYHNCLHQFGILKTCDTVIYCIFIINSTWELRPKVQGAMDPNCSHLGRLLIRFTRDKYLYDPKGFGSNVYVSDLYE